MRTPAKYAEPMFLRETFVSPVLHLALRNRLTVFTAPSGYLPTAQLAAAAHGRHAPLVWLRAGEEDRDPGILLVSLIQALQKTGSPAGAETLAAMRRQPGPVGGWAPLFAAAAREYNAVLPDGAVLVMEHAGKLAGSACLELLGAHFLPLLAEGTTSLILTHEPLPPGWIPLQSQQFRARDLKVTGKAGLDVSHDLQINLPDRSLMRALNLSEGRVGLVENLGQACLTMGKDVVTRSIDESFSLDDLLFRLARAWIGTLNPGVSHAALAAVQMQDFHPEMMQMIISAQPPAEPTWLQPLEGGWQRVLCGWSPPLSVALKAQQRTNPNLLQAMARQMEKEGMTDRAVRLYLDTGDFARAAETMSGLVSSMLDLGQWDTLGEWLSRLPGAVQREWPWLVYAHGELAVTRKDGTTAQRMFSLSTALFRQQRSPEGICQSLLTESVLAAWQSDRSQALNYAHAARSEAREAGLLLYQAYANWQVGCLYADQEMFADGMQFFEECRANAEQAGEPLVMELAVQVKGMIAQRMELAQQSEQYLHALQTLDAAQQEVARAIQVVLDSPASNLNLLLAERGWSHTPLNLKSHAFEIAPARTEGRGLSSLWQSLLSVFRFPGHEENPLPPALPLPALAPAEPPVEITPAEEIPITALPQPSGPEPEARPSAEIVDPEPHPMLTAYLLGPFHLLIEDRPVTTWSGGRGRTLFQYLLAHHKRPRTREELMSVFWPEAPEKAARNNLNVAVHSLRQAVRRVSEIDVVIYREGVYRINPQLSLWVDVDSFEQALDTARQQEAAGDQNATIQALEAATNLYQDDFLSGDPYEEWTLQTREQLRLIYMEALDRLSQLYFDAGQYATSAALCQRILGRDACREDAHCRLMLCYTHMGERPLALRQYQLCADALRAELNTSPSPSTILLFQKIRRQE